MAFLWSRYSFSCWKIYLDNASKLEFEYKVLAASKHKQTFVEKIPKCCQNQEGRTCFVHHWFSKDIEVVWRWYSLTPWCIPWCMTTIHCLWIKEWAEPCSVNEMEAHLIRSWCKHKRQGPHTKRKPLAQVNDMVFGTSYKNTKNEALQPIQTMNKWAPNYRVLGSKSCLVPCLWCSISLSRLCQTLGQDCGENPDNPLCIMSNLQ